MLEQLDEDVERVWEELEDTELSCLSEVDDGMTEETLDQAQTIYKNLKANKRRFGNPPDKALLAGSTCTVCCVCGEVSFSCCSLHSAGAHGLSRW